ncbi:hypothetical protein [Candidatus Uabimicrobium amorphum]|uniref:RNA ligase domain-containing protein n=1 Tax=Uabimicrobium amorphum TaxID=2596890 RepID=A0A5S9F6T9_UABAM|nr:hypothetical protein [Candidatus Uabimicrobium amorphum]BBM88058.1 hypothetical protein UABAM_06474 [Candidatus Uabimicrobium amorphum]
MKKTPTIFKRDEQDRKKVIDEVYPGCEWVFAGEGVATRKYDGTCVKIEDGKYFKRREVKKGKSIPDGFIQEVLDETTGKRFGWMEVDPELAENKWHMEAFDASLTPGTYELVGPKIQGNLEGYETHTLVKHSDAEKYDDVPRSFSGISQWLEDKDVEGLVFHHPDGRMAKIKKRDFGLKR